MRISSFGKTTGAFLLGFLATGIPFWMIPYSKLNVPDAFLGFGLVVVCLMAFLLTWSETASLLKSVNVMAMAMPAALMLRVIVEGLMEPTRHNLWPLVLVITLVMGYLTALPGAGLGHLLRRGRPR